MIHDFWGRMIHDFWGSTKVTYFKKLRGASATCIIMYANNKTVGVIFPIICEIAQIPDNQKEEILTPSLFIEISVNSYHIGHMNL